ncbi:hypothetical protein AAG570_006497 [Ranatra chinensis]|uniref:Protein amnionless n=1 Tax=Ranatra chinensis TaxID=642074 RepID=A0ABD0ZHE2_9HEMI
MFCDSRSGDKRLRRSFSNTLESKENIFQGVKVSRWLDYDNWSGSNKATPHVERIPCQHDNAVFPAGSSFAVEQPPVPVAISKFILGKEIMYGKILEEFLSSELGQREFPKPVSFSDLPNILATNYGECQHSSRGCECDTYQLQEYVCVKQCPRAPCFHPVKPLGFCCHICALSDDG